VSLSLIILLQILSVIAQQAAYTASLSWLAWRSERAHGEDAFHLVIALAGAQLLCSFLTGLNLFPQFPVILISGALGYAIDIFWARTAVRLERKYSLARTLVVASLALIVSDWANSRLPASLPVSGFGARILALLAAALAWLGIFFHHRSRSGWLLRLGTRSRWAMQYWARPTPVPPYAMRAVDYLCWVAVVALPVAETGPRSLTIFKDVAISILVARVASTRGPASILAACFTLAAMRAGAGFGLAGDAWLPLLEAAFFVCLLLWFRRGSRAGWREVLGR
jgi:hypothetical protein